MVKVEYFNGHTYIDHALLQDENGEKKEITGKVFDIARISDNELLSSKERVFSNLLWCIHDAEFAKYLMHAQVLVPTPRGTIAYYPKGKESKPENAEFYHSEHESERILIEIRDNRWDISEVLADIAKRTGDKNIFQEARNLILKGYSAQIKL